VVESAKDIILKGLEALALTGVVLVDWRA